MNPKVAVIAIAVILVTAVLLVVYGATRPAAPASFDARDSAVDRWLGWLRFTEALTVADLEKAGAPCLDRDDEALRLSAGSTCEIALPDKDTWLPVTETVTLSRGEGTFTVVLRGDDFDPQEFDSDDEGDEDDGSWEDDLLELSSYDTNSLLTIRCGLGGDCVVGVVEP